MSDGHARDPPPRPRPRRARTSNGPCVEHDGGAWRRSPGPRARSTTPIRTTSRTASSRSWPRSAAEAIRALGRSSTRRDRRARAVRPGDGRDAVPRQHARAAGRAARSPARSRRRSGVPVALINDARAFGLAELRLGAGRGASSMIGLTLGTGVGGVIAIDGQRPPGPRRHGRRDRPPDDRPRRAAVRLRQPRLPRGLRAGRPDRRTPAGRRPRRRPSSARPGR